LPVVKFKADEEGLVIGEIEEFAPGKTGRITLNLKRGRYLLICNVVGHYMLGMTREFRVT
jgi:uncharacterized cupredoxin-like copper-binding protein